MPCKHSIDDMSLTDLVNEGRASLTQLLEREKTSKDKPLFEDWKAVIDTYDKIIETSNDSSEKDVVKHYSNRSLCCLKVQFFFVIWLK